MLINIKNLNFVIYFFTISSGTNLFWYTYTWIQLKKFINLIQNLFYDSQYCDN